jgi:uncharacterized coiled-coil protein SlyX
MRIQATVLTFGILTIFSGTVMASSLGTLNSFSAGEPAVAEDVNSNFSTIETAVNDNDSRITAVEGKTTTNESKLTDLETKTTTNESKLTDLETRVTDNETNISNNAESINSLSQVKTRSIWLPPTTGGSSPVVDLQGANKNTVVNATIGKPADYVSQGTDDVNLTIYIHAKLCEGLDIAVGAVTGGYDVGDVNSAYP